MKDNVTDFNKFKEEKMKKNEDEYNLELFMNVISKKQEEMTDGEKFVYRQIKLVCCIPFKEKFTMAIVEFRGKLYLLNATPEKTFEYLGNFEDIISKHLGWE